MSEAACFGRSSLFLIASLIAELFAFSARGNTQAALTQVGYAATPANTCNFNYQGDFANDPNPPTTLISAGCNTLPTSLTANISPTQENSSLLLVNSGWGSLGACSDNLGQQWIPDGPTITNQAGTSAIGRRPPAGATVQGITSVTCSVTFVPMSQAVNLNSATGQEGEHIIQVYEVHPAPGDKLNERMSSINGPVSACQATAGTGGVAIVGLQDGDDYNGMLWSGTNLLSGSLAGTNSATQTWNSNFYDLSGGYRFSYAPANYLDGIKSASAAGGTASLSCAQPYGFCNCFVAQFTSDTDPETGDGDTCASCGEPINLANGNTYIEENDVNIPGLAGGLKFDRTWNSTFSVTHPTEAAGLFGPGWRSTIEERIELRDGGVAKYWRSDGSVWTFLLNTQTNTFQVVAPANQAVSFTSGPTQFTVVYQNGETRLFDGNTGSLTAIQDRNGNTTSVTYDNFNRPITMVDPAGRHLYFAYGNQSFPTQVTGVTSDVNLSLSYSYDNQGNLLSVTKPDHTHLNFQYDSNSLIIAVTDDQSKVLESHSYDSAGRGLSSSRANGVENLSLVYDSAPNTVVLVDSLGNTTAYSSDLFGGKRYVTSGNGSGCSSCGIRGNITNTYDSQGRVSSATDAAGHTTAFTYDANGNVTQKQIQRDSSGNFQTWSYSYNSFGEVLNATDPLSHQTVNTYDSKGNLLTTTTPSPGGNTSGSKTSFNYDTKGELTSVTDPNKNKTSIFYTPAGLIDHITDAQSHTTKFTYDLRGNRTAVIDANNQQTTFTYDSMNRLTKITYPTTPATFTQFGYDYRGRKISVTDPNNKVTQYAYDDADRLTSVTDANNGTTNYGYDSESNLTTITDAAGNPTTFQHDPYGRVTQVAFPSSWAETYSYDLNGNLLTKTDRNGHTISYSYDFLNLLRGKSYPDGTAVSYTYDLANRLEAVSDPTGTYQFSYDNMGRVFQPIVAYSFIPGKSFTLVNAYDANSNRTSMIDPQAAKTTYTYDSLNRLTTLTYPTRTNYTFSYDALSRRTQLTRPNSVNTNYQYDTLSRLTSILHQKSTTTLDGATYLYDAAGNRTSKTDKRTNVTSTFGYDPLYELTQVQQGATTTESYGYDAVGNRLSSIGVSPYSYNSSNELTSTPTATYTYDKNGNMLTKTDSTGTTQYNWDFENRLSSVVLPGSGGTVSFKYDPFGRRIQKTSSSGTTNYVYDGANTLEEVDGAGNVLARYVQSPGVDQPLSETRGSTTSYYQADGLGSVTSLSNSSAALANTYTYDSYGKLTTSSGTVANPFRYTGRDFDSETGLSYYRARYYDPTTGRFISEDPIQFVSGVDFYTYGRNNPVIFGDPLGLSDILITINRNRTTQQSTMGTLTVAVDGSVQFQGYSLEPSGTQGSNRLPTGSYDASVYQSPRLGGQDVLLLQDTDPMTFVEIHPGNYPKDTHGCILPGTTQKRDYVGNSRTAFSNIMNIVNSTQSSDQKTGEQTTITVTIQ
jgi:RHS repeat-associated protein